MRPWKYPKTMDTGRKMTSLGFRMKSPMSFTAFVKPNMKTNWAQNAYWRFCNSQFAVAHQQEASSNGSMAKAREVKVAMWRA